jgi:hypothetical protein
MAKGFAQEKKTKQSKNNYKTIFERVKEKTGGEEKSWQWYRQTVRSIALDLKQHPEHLQRDEKKDRYDTEELQDVNRLRRFARQGRIFIFEYKAKMKYLPYYDQFPLAYVLHATPEYFIGANLHYIHPKKRPLIIQKLHDDRVDVPKVCIHKYILDHVDGFLLDLASAEWDTAIALPIESFVKNKNGVLMPYKSSDVWEETNSKFSDRIKAKRIIKGYGKPSDIEEVS